MGISFLKYSLVWIFLGLGSMSSWAQVGFQSSFIYQRSNFIDLGVVKNLTFQPKAELFDLRFQRDIFGPSIASEINFDGEDFIIGPKIGFEYANILGGKVNIIYYTDFERESWKFTPEISLRLWEIPLSIFYGYQFSLSTDSFGQISRNRIALNFNTLLR